MHRSKAIVSTVLVPSVIGLVGLVSLIGKPRFETFHNVDVLQLLGSGMCFGVALATTFTILRGKRGQ